MGVDSWKNKMALGEFPVFIAFCLREGTDWYYSMMDKSQIEMLRIMGLKN